MDQSDLSDVIDVQCHGYSDASGKAYASVVYLRFTFTNGDVKTVFVASKTRVAPMKKIRIPRLELMACLLLTQLLKSVLGAITDRVISTVYCWTDSKDCLYWIGNRSKI